MAEYISSFATGFASIILNDMPRRLPGVQIIKAYDGLVHYRYNGNPGHIQKLVYFNNSFSVIRSFHGDALSFPRMVREVASTRSRYGADSGTFRIRYSLRNQFTKVDRSLASLAEDCVLRHSLLRLDRLNPSTEIWYIIRSEGIGFYAQMLPGARRTEKDLSRGELRPELAYLIGRFARIGSADTVLDPFAGSGAIPYQILQNMQFGRLIISDIDGLKAKRLSARFSGEARVTVRCEDALKLDAVADGSVDAIVTDPPWGLFERMDELGRFYSDMFEAFLRVLKENGSITVLTAAKQEIRIAAEKHRLGLTDSLDTLVNGKKAGLFRFVKRP
jgi:16S rRNA G966 N2-methylase RsmD